MRYCDPATTVVRTDLRLIVDREDDSDDSDEWR